MQAVKFYSSHVLKSKEKQTNPQTGKIKLTMYFI